MWTVYSETSEDTVCARPRSVRLATRDAVVTVCHCVNDSVFSDASYAQCSAPRNPHAANAKAKGKATALYGLSKP